MNLLLLALVILAAGCGKSTGPEGRPCRSNADCAEAGCVFPAPGCGATGVCTREGPPFCQPASPDPHARPDPGAAGAFCGCNGVTFWQCGSPTVPFAHAGACTAPKAPRRRSP